MASPCSHQPTVSTLLPQLAPLSLPSDLQLWVPFHGSPTLKSGLHYLRRCPSHTAVRDLWSKWQVYTGFLAPFLALGDIRGGSILFTLPPLNSKVPLPKRKEIMTNVKMQRNLKNSVPCGRRWTQKVTYYDCIYVRYPQQEIQRNRKYWWLQRIENREGPEVEFLQK